jgi:hypothetical protein
MRVRSTKLRVSNAANAVPASITSPKPPTQKVPSRDGRAVQPLTAARLHGHPVACRCGSLELWRSNIRWYEWPLAIGFAPLRCKRCKARFWRTRSRRAPLVWLDITFVAFNTLATNPVTRTILLMLLVAASGAGLGYLLSKLATKLPF